MNIPSTIFRAAATAAVLLFGLERTAFRPLR